MKISSLIESCDNNNHIVAFNEEQIKKPSKVEISNKLCSQVLPFVLIFVFTCFINLLICCLVPNHPQISIEEITASKIDISSSPLTHYTSLSAHNLTINFVVENLDRREVEYESILVLISYKGHILWANTLGLYHQQKGERTRVRIHFDNSPIEIKGNDVAKEMNTTNGYGDFMVEIHNTYKWYKSRVRCYDVKIHQFASSFTQEITPRFPKKCSEI